MWSWTTFISVLPVGITVLGAVLGAYVTIRVKLGVLETNQINTQSHLLAEIKRLEGLLDKESSRQETSLIKACGEWKESDRETREIVKELFQLIKERF